MLRDDQVLRGDQLLIKSSERIDKRSFRVGDHFETPCNADSQDGLIKGDARNCSLIALSDAGCLPGGIQRPFWIIIHEPGITVRELAHKHPDKRFIVAYTSPAKEAAPGMPEFLRVAAGIPEFFPPTGHLTAMVNGTLFNSKDSCLDLPTTQIWEISFEEPAERKLCTHVGPEEFRPFFYEHAADSAL